MLDKMLVFMLLLHQDGIKWSAVNLSSSLLTGKHALVSVFITILRTTQEINALTPHCPPSPFPRWPGGCLISAAQWKFPF